MEKLYGKTTSKNKKDMTKKIKENRNKDTNEVAGYQGPWAGYG